MLSNQRTLTPEPPPPRPHTQTTTATGIRALMPGLDIDDYVFEPCGYSMNGIRGTGFVTIHITPEDGFSYASVEVTGFDADACDPTAMVGRITRIFRPAHMSVSMSQDVASRTGGYSWGALGCAPPGYGCQSATCQELAAGGRVSFYTLASTAAAEAEHEHSAALTRLPSLSKALLRAESPPTLLKHMPSFASLPALDSDLEMSSGSGDERDSSGGSGGSNASAKSGAKWAPGGGALKPPLASVVVAKAAAAAEAAVPAGAF